MGTKLSAHVAIFLSCVFAGLAYVSSKVLLDELSPAQATFLRFSLAAAGLFLLRPHVFRHGLGIKGELMFAACGLLGIALFFFLQTCALSCTYASNVSVISCTAPLLTGLAGSVFLKEKLSFSFFAGFVLSIAVIWLIVYAGKAVAEISPLGDALAVCATASWASYSIVTKKLLARPLPLLESTRRMILWGVAALGIYLLFQPETLRLSCLFKAKVAFNLLFLGFGSSCLCYLGWNYALKILGATTTSAYAYLIPGAAVLSSCAVLGEVPTARSAIGMLLAVAGVLVSRQGEIPAAMRGRSLKSRLHRMFPRNPLLRAEAALP